MTLASRINRLIAGIAVSAGIIVTLFVGQRDYSYQREALLLGASSFVGSHPQLQFNLYFRDRTALRNAVEDVLSLSPAIRRAVVFDNQGNVLIEAGRDWAGDPQRRKFTELRDGLPPLESGRSRIPGGSLPPDLESLAVLEKSLFLTLPITSVVNPTEENVTRAAFGEALTHPERARSLHVIGYLGLDISNVMLWRQSMQTIALSAGVGLGIVLVMALIARLMLRRVTAPLASLTQLADDIAAGKATRPLSLGGSGELHEIANALNGIITGFHRQRTELDADRRRLHLKIDERTQQLSQRDQQLDEAEKRMSEANVRLRRMAYFDSLTELPNRRLFTEQLTLLLRIAARNKSRVGLLLVDIDHFKRINDSLGDKCGDKLLREISSRLTAGVRESDVLHRTRSGDGSVMDLSRVGGDEFTVVLNQVDSADAAQKVANRLAASIHRPCQIDGQEIIVTASIGMAIAPDHADDVEGLMRAANTAMITAKKRGRNCVLLYDESMEATNRERLQLETDLRRAIEQEELLLHFQPQVHAGTGVVCGAESLVRWKHPQRGMVPPFLWIPMAEELGLISDIGFWVLDQACRTLVALRQDDLKLPKVSVNVSALQFTDDFAQRVQSILESHSLSPESIELELTEGIMVNDDEELVERVRALKELGLRLSIDDFGTGYSSLSYLSRFPLDELKIDRSFVVGLRRGERNAELVRAIIALGKSLHLSLVVEGVERAEELAFFRDEGADVIQGYLFSPPVPERELRTLLRQGHFEEKIRSFS